MSASGRLQVESAVPSQTRVGGGTVVLPCGGTHVPSGRDAARPLRDRRADRRGRDGRGLPRRGHAARPDVAIKVLPAQLRADERAAARFEREAKAISSLNHPNICTLFDVGHEGGSDYLVMELIEGETLADRLQRARCRPTRCCATARDRRRARPRAPAGDRPPRPEAGQRHADEVGSEAPRLRPRARRRGAGAVDGTRPTMPTQAQPLTQEGTILGTFQYMAPEQLEGREADARSDIFALGALLYEMATGRRAFEGRARRADRGDLSAQPRRSRRSSPMTPPALDRRRPACLAKDPDDRWQTRARRRDSSCAGSRRAARRPGCPRRSCVRRAASGRVGGGRAAFRAPPPSSALLARPAPRAERRAALRFSRRPGLLRFAGRRGRRRSRPTERRSPSSPPPAERNRFSGSAFARRPPPASPIPAARAGPSGRPTDGCSASSPTGS